MKVIDDPLVLNHYLSISGFCDFFSFDVLEHVLLFRADEKEDILKEGHVSSPYLYYLVEGCAKLFCSLSNGKTSLIDFVQGGSFLGEMEFLSVRNSTMAVRALSECFVLALPIDLYRDKLLSDATFLKVLCLNLAEKEEQRVSLLLRTQGFPLVNRLAHFILFSSTEGVYSESNTDASAYLGISYRHLSQVLAKFCELGLIVKELSDYRIKDLKALSDLASELHMDL